MYCKDCMHYEVCKHHGCVVEFEVDDGVCLHFAPDTNVGVAVDVVRCMDCKHWEDGYIGYCTKMHTAMEYSSYCSRGERK